VAEGMKVNENMKVAEGVNLNVAEEWLWLSRSVRLRL